MRYQRLALGALAALALQAGAVSVAAADRTFELQLIAGKVAEPQRKLRVSKGDKVTLRVSSDEAGQLHLHAYHVDATLTANQASVVSFEAYATGRFRLQWHPAKPATQPAGEAVGHHAAALATLDVMPR